MERNEENTQKLIKFYSLYEPISLGFSYEKYKKDLTEEYVWKEFNKTRNWKVKSEKIFNEEGDGTIQDFIEGGFLLDPIFEPYHGSDFSFLKPYPKNIRELLLKQILFDTRKTYDDIGAICYILDQTGKKEPPKRDPHEVMRDQLHNLITSIDEFITVLEFFDNPPKPLVALHKIKKVEKLPPYTQEDINKILDSIDEEDNVELWGNVKSFGGR